MDSESDDSTLSLATRDEAHDPTGQAPRRPAKRNSSVTSRWQIGRLVRISVEAACGFIRSSTGELIYFAMDDVVKSSGTELRAGSRVRFRQVGAGVPRAVGVEAT